MRYQHYLFSTVVATMCVLSGCRSAIPNHDCYVDDLCDDGGFAVHHGQICAIPALKPNISQSAAVAIIAAYLRGDPGACKARGIYWTSFPIRVRSRDYWALVLAQITNMRLQIMVDDADIERDRKIDKLLNELDTSPEQGLNGTRQPIQ